MLRPCTRVLACLLLVGSLPALGCGARTTLDDFADGAPSRLDAGTRVDVGAAPDTATDAAPTGCSTDDDCPNDGLDCNGRNLCNPLTGTCEMLIPERCDDFVACTDDRCVEGAGCVFTPNDALCDDGAICNPAAGCVGVCMPVADSEFVCRDGRDDDCDGDFDCADPDCFGRMECVGCQPFESECADGSDEDCDSLDRPGLSRSARVRDVHPERALRAQLSRRARQRLQRTSGLQRSVVLPGPRLRRLHPHRGRRDLLQRRP
jgi:hypothetical protein